MGTRGWLLLATLLLPSCDDDIEQPNVVQLRHDEVAPTGDGGHVIPPPKCAGKCCPDPATAPECYLNGKNPSEYSGAECMAQRDNTGADHWQLRQTQSISTRPPGNADTIIAGILMQRSELHSVACRAGDGASGFIQLVDLDIKNNVALTGFATRIVEQSDALQSGLCFVKDRYDDPDPKMKVNDLYPPPPGWPKGLPPPKSLPWDVAPVRAYGYAEDFDLKSQREKILERFDPDNGDLAAQGYDGIFYLDKAKGYMHGYSPRGYVVQYNDASTYNAIPIREAEITSQINDPEHPNCSGVYGANDLPTGCATSDALPAWTCPTGDCLHGELGPTKVEGYFLIVEAEQVHISALSRTLCYMAALGAYPMAAAGAYPAPWTIEADQNSEFRCRNNPNWNPSDPVHGLPPGDWCATTNSKATDECHDAWKSISYSTFQAFPIQVGKTCPAI